MFKVQNPFSEPAVFISANKVCCAFDWRPNGGVVTGAQIKSQQGVSFRSKERKGEYTVYRYIKDHHYELLAAQSLDSLSRDRVAQPTGWSARIMKRWRGLDYKMAFHIS